MLRLVITKKGEPLQEERPFGDSLEESADLVTIGRAETNDVVLEDLEGMISRHHAVLVRLPGPDEGYFLRDLSSRNSTWVDGQAVCTKRLRHGDVVVMGDYSLTCWFQEETLAEHHGREGDLPIVIGERKSSRNPGPKGQVALPTRLGSDHQKAAGQPGTDHREETIEELLRKAQMVSAADGLFREFIGPILHGVEADRGFIALFSQDSGVCHCVARQLARNEKIRIADGDYLETLRQGMRIAEGRVLLVPFRREGEVAGFFCANRKPGKPFFSLADGDFLENLGSQLITHLLKRAKLQAGVEQGTGEVIDEGLEWPLEMVGHSAAMKEVWRQIQDALEQETPVLITGETGTGKELVTTAIHHRSSRSQGPLVAINCAAIPESLLESELFGHEKGAFTDARDQHRGLFEQADRGTLFLDEVGEMAPAAQVRLLRVLEEQKVTRIGGTRSIAVDVRVVAATNKDLKEAVAQGAFRRDLYHRLKVLELHLPPLRQRREDIPLLAHYFIDRFAKRRGKKTRWISRLALQQLLNHDWPGNVRELRNLVASAVSGEREVIMTQTQRPDPAPLRGEELDVAHWTDKGVSLAALGRHQEALPCFDCALEADPRYVPAWTGRGISQAALGQHPEAVSCFDRALKVDRHYAPAWTGKGSSRAAVSQHPEALVCFDHALEADRHYAPAWTGKGISQAALGRHPEALRLHERAIQLNPWSAAARVNKGVALAQMGQTEKALWSFVQAIDIDRWYAPAWYHRGAVLVTLGRYREALECCDQALVLEQGCVPAWYNRGIALATMQQHHQALECYGRALELDARCVPAWYHQGLAFAALNQHAEALASYDRALEFDKRHVPAWYHQGLAFEALKQHRKALACYNRTLSADLGHGPAWHSRGRILPEVLRNHGAARLCFEKAARLGFVPAEERGSGWKKT